MKSGSTDVQEFSSRVRDSILPLSVATSLPAAFREWRFTDRSEDHGRPIETCQLCGQEKLRYHFEIGNDITDETLWVGSHCILKFDVAVLREGRRLTTQEAKRRLTELTNEMQLKTCIGALEKLAVAENNRILDGALDYYKRHGKLTPKYANVVFWRLKTNGIDHQPGFFKVELKRQQHIDDLKEMPTKRVHRFWAALSPAQRRQAIALGHTAPENSSP